MRLTQGAVIVASDRMPDPGFANAVILLITHLPQGTVGLNLTDFQGVDIKGLEGCRVFNGGPMPGISLALHKADLATADSDVMGDTGYAFTWIGIVDDGSVQPGDLVRRPGVDVMLNYSGWDLGGVEEEVLLGLWGVASARLETILAAAPEERWKVASEGATFNRFLFGTGNMSELTNGRTSRS